MGFDRWLPVELCFNSVLLVFLLGFLLGFTGLFETEKIPIKTKPREERYKNIFVSFSLNLYFFFSVVNKKKVCVVVVETSLTRSLVALLMNTRQPNSIKSGRPRTCWTDDDLSTSPFSLSLSLSFSLHLPRSTEKGTKRQNKKKTKKNKRETPPVCPCSYRVSICHQIQFSY